MVCGSLGSGKGQELVAPEQEEGTCAPAEAQGRLQEVAGLSLALSLGMLALAKQELSSHLCLLLADIQ